ncbi:efflux RND transporter permease subunit [Thermodesulfobacteriota bacterium]
MYALARYATKRPVAVIVLAAAIIMVGWISWKDLPLDLLPDIQSPTILVSIKSGDRPPTEMERIFGEAVERNLFAVEGIRSISQVARSGILIARVTFDWDSNMDLALVDVQKAINPISNDTEVDEVLVRRQDPRQLPILTVGIVAPEGAPDLTELRRIAKRQLAPGLERLEGVAEVGVTGGREEEVHIILDKYLMEAHSVTTALIEQRISAVNRNFEAGTLEERDNVYLVRGISRFKNVNDVARVVVKYDRDSNSKQVPVRIGDIGKVLLSEKEVTDLVVVDGKEGVSLSIYKEAGANTVKVSRNIRDALKILNDDLQNIEFKVVSDEAALVEVAVEDVKVAAAIGIILAVIVLTFFLRSIGTTVVVASAVPVSLAATLFAMHFGGYSLNLMTLGGMALGAGMLVDNAIVVIESIFRRRSEGDPPMEAAPRGTAMVAGAITASTLTTCVVFLPVLFIQGLAARLVSGIAFTVVASLFASLGVAIFLIPALARWFLPRSKTKEIDPGKAKMESLVLGLLKHPLLVVIISILLVSVAVKSLMGLGTELLAPADPSQFAIKVAGPPGQRIESTQNMVKVVEDIIRQAAGDDLNVILSEVGKLPDDDHYIREERTGENTARILVSLSSRGRTASQVVNAASPAVSGLSNIEVSWELGTSTIARAIGTSGPPIQVEISGKSLYELKESADDILKKLKSRKELWNQRSSFEGGAPELHVILNRTLCDALGINIDTLSRILETALDGREISKITTGDEEKDIILSVDYGKINNLKSIPFTTSNGERFTVGDVADIREVDGALEIFRRNQKRVARVTARVAPGVEYPVARSATEEVLKNIDIGPGLAVKLAGEEEEREKAFSELKWAVIIAILLVFMVLAGTFESLVHPLTVLASIPLALVGVAVVLVPGGRPVGIMEFLGIIVLFGIAVNDAILMVQTARQLMADGLEGKKALARAAAIRLRPILMTTFTTVLALLPLAIGVGEAAQLRAPLALTIIGGVCASTLFSLITIPCLYHMLDFFRRNRGN